MPLDQKIINICNGMLDAINSHNYARLSEVMADDFRDHHTGLGEGISSLKDYQNALEYVHNALDIKARLDIVFAEGDKIATMAVLKGRHIGNFMGIAPTGKKVEWSTIEFYRIENGKIKERWALDDMAGLLKQLGVILPF